MELPTPQDLRQRRNALDLTQAALAERAGVSQPLIARIEGGDVDPRLSTLRRIVNALDEAEGGVVRAADLMNESVISVAPDDSVHEAQRRMEKEGYSQLPVIHNGSLKGWIGHANIADSGEKVGDLPVSDVMSEDILSVGPEKPVEEIRNLLKHFDALIVIDGGEAVGIITKADIARQLS